MQQTVVEDDLKQVKESRKAKSRAKDMQTRSTQTKAKECGEEFEEAISETKPNVRESFSEF